MSLERMRVNMLLLQLDSKCRLRLRTLVLIAGLGGPMTLGAQRFGEDAYNYLGDRPTEGMPGWHDEAQGLAHDRDHWYIAQALALWKIPVSHDLAAPAFAGVAGVRMVSLIAIPALAHHNHFGDPELFTTNGQGYLFVPVTEYDSATFAPSLAVFRGSDLSYVTHQVMPFELRPAMAWCAFDPEGYLYLPGAGTNDRDPLRLIRYRCDFNALERNPPSRSFLVVDGHVDLLDEAGVPIDLDWKWQQGGVISPSGQLLYITAGSHIGLRESHGIHVFQLRTAPSTGEITGQRIARSSLSDRPFSFAFFFLNGEEPEGLTFWDLDDDPRVGAPRGQLHALMLDNGWVTDDVFLKRYTSAIFVDRRSPSGGLGIPDSPYNTVAHANDQAWNGVRLRIRTGNYPEHLTFSKRLRLTAENGPVTIGR